MHRETASVLLVSYLKQLLEELSIEDADKEIEARVIIRDDSKKCCLLFTKLPQIKLIGNCQACHAFKIELIEPRGECDLY